MTNNSFCVVLVTIIGIFLYSVLPRFEHSFGYQDNISANRIAVKQGSCRPGQYLASSGSCDACPSNSYSSGGVTGACSPCPSGTRCAAGKGTCQKACVRSSVTVQQTGIRSSAVKSVVQYKKPSSGDLQIFLLIIMVYLLI